MDHTRRFFRILTEPAAVRFIMRLLAALAALEMLEVFFGCSFSGRLPFLFLLSVSLLAGELSGKPILGLFSCAALVLSVSLLFTWLNSGENADAPKSMLLSGGIFLLIGLDNTTAANASLLNNFEIVATAIIALMIFKEKISPRLWAGIFFVVLSCALLSFEDISSLKFSAGSLFVLLAAVCWGFENNCTRKLSSKDPLQIVLLKGIFSGLGSIVIGLCIGERLTSCWSVFAVLGVGFVAYGLSIFFYVYAQRILGAARTSAYYAVAPFIGTLLSLVIFREMPKVSYFISLAAMAVGAWLCSKDEPIFKKREKRNKNCRKKSGENHQTISDLYPNGCSFR